MTMKNISAIVAVIVAASLQAHATLYTYNFTGINAAIPDGDGAGYSDTRILSGLTDEIADVNVTLNISGGYNGDLYGYLVHDSGFAVLLNRIGRTSTDEFGSSGSGLSVTLDDQAGGNDIHLAPYLPGAVRSGTWTPDGRETDPANVLDTDSRTATLASFNGADPNGSWTLFLADLSAGDQSTLVSWGLEISTVPEPTTWALLAFASLTGTVGAGRWVKRRLQRAEDVQNKIAVAN